MANEEQVKRLLAGVREWNEWRRVNSYKPHGDMLLRPDLVRANLSGATLSGADLSGTHLGRAQLSGAHLGRANLTGANLNRTDLRGAKLREADLKGAYLVEAVFADNDLDGCDFSNSTCGSTHFSDMNFRECVGLETVRHLAPSFISIDSLVRSHGQVPEVFLRGAGVPESFITNIRSLISAMDPIQFHSCFISYSSRDSDFADRVRGDLQAKGIRVWFAPEDLKIGDKFHDRIEESIRVHDKLMIVLSQHSIESDWVESEVKAGLDREAREKRQVLFPIRIDDAITDCTKAWAADIRRKRHIGDLTRWKEQDHYKKGFDRLLRDLRASTEK
jgi:hypothetical protein